ncbi:MAG: hypothetical protein MZW92_79760 [Comamonadaceae bacterium]|nr:hypothetical protein [Comamonadaceae bacterium]
MAVINPFDFFLEPQAEKFPFTYEDVRNCAELGALPGEAAGATPLLRTSIWLPVARKSRASRRAASISWWSSTASLQEHVRYLIRLEPGVQTPEETLQLRHPAPAATRPGCWCQLLAAPGTGGPLRLRLPDPAHAPT